MTQLAKVTYDLTQQKQPFIGFGVSLDLDAIDSKDTPGVGVPEPDGIHVGDLCQVLTRIQQEKQSMRQGKHCESNAQSKSPR